MKQDLFCTLKHTVIYGFGKSSEQFAKFLLLPLYTKFLTTSDYGILSIITLLAGFAQIVFGLGAGTSVFRFYRRNEKSTNLGSIFYSSMFLVTTWSLFLLVLIFGFRSNISQLLFSSDSFGSHIIIALGTTALGAAYAIPMFILRAKGQAARFIVNNYIKLFLTIAFSLFFIVVLERGVLGAIEAGFCSALLFALYTIIACSTKTQFSFDRKLIFQFLTYGSPLIIAGLGMVVLNSSDKYILKEYATLEILGIYSVGYTLGAAINIPIGAFQNAWPKLMFDYKDRENSGIFYGKVLTYYLIAMGAIWLGIFLFSKELVMLMTAKSFWPSYQVIPIISLAYIFMGAGSITSAGIYTKDKTHLDLFIFPFASVICLLANFLLIGPWGMIGAAWATLLSFFCLFGLHTILGSKQHKIQFEGRKLATIGGAIAVVVLTVIIFPQDWSPNFGHKLIFYIIFTAFVSLVLLKEELRILRKLEFKKGVLLG